MSFDFAQLWNDTRALRGRAAARPLLEKLQMLDALRERALSIRGARLREAPTLQKQPLASGAES